MRGSVPGPSAGFTLLEVLLAMVLLATLFAVLLPTLTTAARSWSAATERVEAASARTRALDTLERLLSQARPLPRSEASEDDGLAFLGQANSLVFVSALPAYRSGGGLQVMRLHVGDFEGQRGLVLDWYPYHPEVPMTGEGAEQGRREMLLPNVKTAKLAYFGKPENAEKTTWLSAWEQPRLPQLIRARLALAEGGVVEAVAAPQLAPPREAGMEGPLQ